MKGGELDRRYLVYATRDGDIEINRCHKKIKRFIYFEDIQLIKAMDVRVFSRVPVKNSIYHRE